jgi:hypothetical protein
MLTDEQKKAVADLMEEFWGGHFQTGHVDVNVVTLWAKTGPNVDAACFMIAPNGDVSTEISDWDGRAWT